MKNLFKIGLFAYCLMFVVACSDDEEDDATIVAGDYDAKEYALERDPSVNVWGAGMDFIHTDNASDSVDYEYLSETDDYPYDVKFYTVKAYYTTSTGATASEGCPAMLLSTGSMGCKIGAGVAFFDTCSVITSDVLANLTYDHVVNYSACKNSDGTYNRALLYAALDSCIIGRSFRSGVLVVPDSLTEQEVQPVYLIKTAEGGYVKFMVKQFKGDTPNEKQTIVRWQVMKE